MQEYTLHKLDGREYDGILLCLTYESIMNYLCSIEKEKMISDTKGVILIDQLLVTGNGSNRYLVCPYDHGTVDVHAAENVLPSEYYKKVSVQLLHQYYSLLGNSILTDQQRYNIENGIAF